MPPDSEECCPPGGKGSTQDAANVSTIVTAAGDIVTLLRAQRAASWEARRQRETADGTS